MENAQAVDQPTSDIYSLGMTLAFVVYGSDLPQNAWTDRKSFWRELQCSQRICDVIERATELDPKKRYPSSTAFCDSLRSARKLDQEKPQSLSLGYRAVAQLPRRLVASGIGAMVLCIVALFGWRGMKVGPQVQQAGTSKARRPLDVAPTPVPASIVKLGGPIVAPAVGSGDALPLRQVADKLHIMDRSKSSRRNKDDDDGLQPMELSH